MSIKKSSLSSKKLLREKVVLMYEQLFQGENPHLTNTNFWEEFFLLKPKEDVLEMEISKLGGDQMIALKPVINSIFIQSVNVLGDTESKSHHIKSSNAMQTIAALIEGVMKLVRNEFGYDLLATLMGFERANATFAAFLTSISAIVTGSYPDTLKRTAFRTILRIMTSSEIISKNSVIGYMVCNVQFVESLLLLLGQSETRMKYGYDCLIIIVLLVNYEKERPNDCAVRLSLVDDHMTLNGYTQTITAGLFEFCLQNTASAEQNSGWFHSLTSMVGSIFVADGHEKVQCSCGTKIGLLLAFYEAIHLNRNFMTTLANTKTNSSPHNTLAQGQVPGHMSPSNLLVTFMEYTSVVMQDLKSDSTYNLVKLCFIILTIISEDQYANALMSDSNLVYRVKLNRMQMRHRRISVDINPPMPLMCSLLGLMNEFLVTHLTKRLPFEIYLQSVGIIQRILSYLKKNRIKIGYEWRQLWTTLFSVIKFTTNQEASLVKKFDIFRLNSAIITIINLFITFGDAFLSSAIQYDELYYEIIRCEQTFESLHSLTARFASNKGEFQSSASKLSQLLVNIRAILHHFLPKVDEFLSNHHISTPSEQQIIDVVRANYDSLTLKVPDLLDQTERFAEVPQYSSFFTSLIRVVIKDIRQQVSSENKDLHEFVS